MHLKASNKWFGLLQLLWTDLWPWWWDGNSKCRRGRSSALHVKWKLPSGPFLLLCVQVPHLPWAVAVAFCPCKDTWQEVGYLILQMKKYDIIVGFKSYDRWPETLQRKVYITNDQDRPECSGLPLSASAPPFSSLPNWFCGGEDVMLGKKSDFVMVLLHSTDQRLWLTWGCRLLRPPSPCCYLPSASLWTPPCLLCYTAGHFGRPQTTQGSSCPAVGHPHPANQ